MFDLTEVLGLESIKEEAIATPELGAVIEMDGADMDLASIEELSMSVEAETELFKDELSIQVAVNSEESLAFLQEDLNAAVENGGLKSGTEVAMFQRMYQGAVAPFGGVMPDVPSVEAFGEDGAAELETRASMEAVKESLAKAGAFAMKLILKAIATVKKLFKQYLTANGRARKAVQDLQKAGKAAKGKATGKISVSDLVAGNAVGDLTKYAASVGKEKDLAKGISDLAKAISGYKESEGGDSLETINQARSALAQKVVDTFEANQEVKKDDVLKKAGLKAESYEKVSMTKPLGGGVRIVVGIPKLESGLNVAVKVIKLDGDVSQEVDAIDGGKVASLAGDLAKLVDAHKDVLDAGDPIFKAGEELAKACGSLKDVGNKQVADFLKDAKNLANVVYKGHEGLAKHVASAITANVKFGAASIKTMKSEKKDDKKDDEKDDKGEE